MKHDTDPDGPSLFIELLWWVLGGVLGVAVLAALLGLLAVAVAVGWLWVWAAIAVALPALLMAAAARLDARDEESNR